MYEHFKNNDKISKPLKNIISLLNPDGDEQEEDHEEINHESNEIEVIESQEGNLLDVGLEDNTKKVEIPHDTKNSKPAKFSFIKNNTKLDTSNKTNLKNKEKNSTKQTQSSLSPDDIFGISNNIGKVNIEETPSLFDDTVKKSNLFNDNDIQTFDLTKKTDNLDEILNNGTTQENNDQESKLNKVLNELNKKSDVQDDRDTSVKETLLVTNTSLQISNPLIEEQINIQYKQFKKIYGEQCADDEIYNYAVSVVVNNPLIQKQLANQEGFNIGARNQQEKIVLNKNKDFDSKKVYDSIDDKPKDSFGFVNDLLKKKSN